MDNFETFDDARKFSKASHSSSGGFFEGDEARDEFELAIAGLRSIGSNYEPDPKSEPPKSKRGRPRKSPEPVEPKEPAKRGRPRKSPEPVEPKEPAKRGRPRKSQSTDVLEPTSVSTGTRVTRRRVDESSGVPNFPEQPEQNINSDQDVLLNPFVLDTDLIKQVLLSNQPQPKDPVYIHLVLRDYKMLGGGQIQVSFVIPYEDRKESTKLLELEGYTLVAQIQVEPFDDAQFEATDFRQLG